MNLTPNEQRAYETLKEMAVDGEVYLPLRKIKFKVDVKKIIVKIRQRYASHQTSKNLIDSLKKKGLIKVVKLGSKQKIIIK